MVDHDATSPRAAAPPARTAASFRHAGFFVIRSASLPIERLLAWGGDERHPPAERADDEAWHGERRAALRARLREEVTDAGVREALLLASPSLESRIDGWAAGGAPDGEEALKIERALVRYFQRMCWRTTPFGLFAGTSCGVVGAKSALAAGPLAERRRVTRLDGEYLFALSRALAGDRAIQGRLRCRANGTLYERDGELVFGWPSAAAGAAWSALAIPRSPHTDEILRLAAEGARRGELIAALGAVLRGTSPTTAERFVAGLVEARLVVDDLDPSCVGADFLEHLLRALESVGEAARSARATLLEARRLLAELDARRVPASRGDYAAVTACLSSLPVALGERCSFSADLVIPMRRAEIDERVAADVLSGVDALCALARPAKGPLDAFRSRFAARYGEARVPLLEALDDAVGVGFDGPSPRTAESAPLLGGLALPPRSEPELFTRRDEWLAARVFDAVRSGQAEIGIADAELSALEGAKVTPPDAFSTLVTLHAESAAALENGRYRISLRQLVGPAAASLMGRFCRSDPLLLERARELSALEARAAPGAIMAEIVYLPHPRSANVFARPALRAFEIPVLGAPDRPGVTQIPLADLDVAIEGGRVVLRSSSRGQRVLPRLTCSDNLALPGAPAYRLLASIAADEGASWLAWDWGPLGGLPFLPRVVRGRCILSPARWRLDAKVTAELARSSGGERRRVLERLRERAALPRFTALVERDRALPVDLENPCSVEAFAHGARGGPAVLEEMFPGPGTPGIDGPAGRYAHEIVLPFVRKEPRPPYPLSPPAPRRADRARFVGEDWLCAKLYVSPAATDRALRRIVLPLVERAAPSSDRWFFVRYGDPECHLRVRFHGEPSALCHEVLKDLTRLAGAGRAAGWLHRLEIGTYEPEWERYGGADAMASVERIFHADSDAALRICVLYESDLDARWRLSLAGMYRLAKILLPDVAQRIAVVGEARQAFAEELGLTGRWSRPLGERFRKERTSLVALVAGDLAEGHPLRLGLDVLDERDEQLAPARGALEAELRGLGGPAAGRVVRSLLHMHANRLLPYHQRLQEAVLYDFLTRIHRAEEARG